IARHLADTIRTERLMLFLIKHWEIPGYIIPGSPEFGRRLGCDKWLEFWHSDLSTKAKKTLIRVAAGLRDSRIEDVLIACLENSEFAGASAQSLAMMGSVRASPALRKLLATEPEKNDDRRWNRGMAFHALAMLRDPSCVPEMVQFLKSEDHGFAF